MVRRKNPTTVQIRDPRKRWVLLVTPGLYRMRISFRLMAAGYTHGLVDFLLILVIGQWTLTDIIKTISGNFQ